MEDFPYKQPFFDKKGNLHLPDKIPFGGELNPTLKPNEWFLWILLNSSNVSKKHYENIGSRSTIWRLKKKLNEKGYL